MNKPTTILFDAERMKYPNTGLFYFCKQLAQSLITKAPEANAQVQLFLPSNQQQQRVQQPQQQTDSNNKTSASNSASCTTNAPQPELGFERAQSMIDLHHGPPRTRPPRRFSQDYERKEHIIIMQGQLA